MSGPITTQEKNQRIYGTDIYIVYNTVEIMIILHIYGAQAVFPTIV